MSDKRSLREEVLDVYTQPRDPEKPLVCLDETSKQLVAETRTPIPMKAGQPERVDYEYERNGTANLFMLFAPLSERLSLTINVRCGRLAACRGHRATLAGRDQ